MKSEQLISAVGFFDGIHRAHAEIIRKMSDKAWDRGVVPSVVTFDTKFPTDLSGTRMRFLSPKESKTKLIHTYFPEVKVIFLEFNKGLSEMSPEDFVRTKLKSELNVSEVFVGEDFTFGKDAIGTAELLSGLIETTAVPLITENGCKIGTTKVKLLLESGQFDEAVSLLGHPFLLGGTVVHGDGRGHKIGLTTVNLPLSEEQFYPQQGVYVSLTEVDGCFYPSVTNLGKRPTFYENGICTNETHILDETFDLYGKNIWVWLCQYIRPEKAFSNASLLIEQIKADSKFALDYLNCNYKKKGMYSV